MRKYIISATVNSYTHKKEIVAKNYDSAMNQARKFGYSLSGYGKGFLSGFGVKIKKK